MTWLASLMPTAVLFCVCDKPFTPSEVTPSAAFHTTASFDDGAPVSGPPPAIVPALLIPPTPNITPASVRPPTNAHENP